ncbi:MAG: hypothetical protein WBK26_11210 [Burkholderiaceae bacterium]
MTLLAYLPHIAAAAAWLLLCHWVPEVRRRTLNVLIVLDQVLWVVATLGHGSPDETISAALWRMEQQSKRAGQWFRPVVDILFMPFERDHCRQSYISEFKKLHLPREYRAERF